MQICALGTEDEIFEQVWPVFAACKVSFIVSNICPFQFLSSSLFKNFPMIIMILTTLFSCTLNLNLFYFILYYYYYFFISDTYKIGI